jgi:hypothetical protein
VSEQQWASDVQASPAGRQYGSLAQVLVACSQAREQHSPSVAQVSPVAKHAGPDPTQAPFEHVPEQQL